MSDPRTWTAAEFRARVRRGDWRGPTAGVAMDHVQANLVVVPPAQAFDFLLFCQRNPRPCPLLDVTDPGSFTPALAAPDADLRTDVPGYRVYRDGSCVAEPDDLRDLWPEGGVGVLLGCSFTFEKALLEAGIPVRHIEEGRNVPMYRTSVACRPAGLFRGPLVVSMRPIPIERLMDTNRICSGFPLAHGRPVHMGDPGELGIADLAKPDFGDAVTIRPGEIPTFWACGVTPQAAALASGAPLVLTHRPGHMFVTDLTDASG